MKNFFKYRDDTTNCKHVGCTSAATQRVHVGLSDALAGGWNGFDTCLCDVCLSAYRVIAPHTFEVSAKKITSEVQHECKAA